MDATNATWSSRKPFELHRKWQNWILILPIVLLTSGCEKATFTTSSMTPTIRPGEAVTVDYSAYTLAKPKRWDVVAFEPRSETNQIWLMRIVGMPGETVSFSTNGVMVNNQLLL